MLLCRGPLNDLISRRNDPLELDVGELASDHCVDATLHLAAEVGGLLARDLVSRQGLVELDVPKTLKSTGLPLRWMLFASLLTLVIVGADRLACWCPELNRTYS